MRRRSESSFKLGLKNGSAVPGADAVKASMLSLVEAGLLPTTALLRKHALPSDTPLLVRVLSWDVGSWCAA